MDIDSTEEENGEIARQNAIQSDCETPSTSGGYIGEDAEQQGVNSEVRLHQIASSNSVSVTDSWSVRLRKLLTRHQFYAIIAVAYANFWLSACISLQAPFFPQEAENKGVTATVYGFVFGIFELVIIVTSPIYGKIARFISSKVLISLGVFVAGMCSIMFGFLDRVSDGTMFISLAFAVRIVEGAGAAAAFTAANIVVTSEFHENVATAFSSVETFFGLGLIVGPTMGGAFYEIGGFTLPFVVAGSVLLVGAMVAWMALSKKAGLSDNDEPNHPDHTMLKFLMNVDTILDSLCIITTLSFFGYNSATLEPHIRQFSLGPFKTGLIFMVSGLVYAITTPFWGLLSDKGVNTRLLCVFGCAITAISQAFIGPFPFFPFDSQLWLTIVALAVCGLGDAAKLVCAFANCFKNTQERGFPDNTKTYGYVAGLFASSCSIGAFIGPSIGGYLLDTIGYRKGTIVLFSIETSLMIALIVNLVFRKRFSRRQTANQQQTSDEKRPLLDDVSNVGVCNSANENGDCYGTLSA